MTKAEKMELVLLGSITIAIGAGCVYVLILFLQYLHSFNY